MDIFNQYNKLPIPIMEYNDGESDVDLALYKPIGERVEEYIRSGEILEDNKRLQYHSDYLDLMNKDKNFVDPLTYRGYDRVDLELLHKEAIEEILERRRSGLSTDRGESQKSETTPEAVGQPEKPETPESPKEPNSEKKE